MLRGRLLFAALAVAGAGWWVAVALVPGVREATLGRLDPVAVAIADIPLFVVASALAAFGMRIAAGVAAAWTVVVAVAMAVVATVTTQAGWGALLMVAAAGCAVVAFVLVVLGRVPTEWLLVGPFAFRAARERPSRWVPLLATIVQMVAFWVVFLVVVPLAIAWIEQRWRLAVALPAGIVVAGIVLLVVASALGVGSAIAMAWAGRGTPLPTATARRLVVVGPYRWVRNPMAVAGIVQGIAVGMVLSSWLVVAYAIAGSVVWNVAIRPHEEADLAARFGDDFRRYQAAVRCWLPMIPARTSAR